LIINSLQNSSLIIYHSSLLIYLRRMKNIDSPFYNTYSTWLGHATFAVLTLMAFAFFKERTLILDASLQSFHILKDNDFAIQVNRFGAAMTQIFPLMASRLGGSLKTILIAYSLGFVMVHWAMFWLCDRVLKQKEMAFAIVLFNVFLVNNTFFWAQNELIQAISLGFVFWSLLLRRGSFTAFRWYDYLLTAPILVTLVFFHPLMLFTFGFISVYFLTEAVSHKPQASSEELQALLPTQNLLSFSRNKTQNLLSFSRNPLSIPLILTGLIGFFVIYFLKSKFFPNFYDASTSSRIVLHETLLNFILRLTEVPSYKDFASHLWSDFTLLPIVLAALTVFYLIKKSILKLLLVWVSVLGYILVVMISYREGGSWFHIESQYLPMSIFLIVPLVWEFIPEMLDFKFQISRISNTTDIVRNWHLTSKTLGIVLTIAVFSRLIDIYLTHDFYEKRTAYIGELLEKTKKLSGNKFAVEERLIDKNRLMQTWGFEYESLYYSALQSPDSVRNIAIFNNRNDIQWQLGPEYTPKRMFNSVKYEDLNPRLFHQTDTINPFIILEEKDLK
jgi:hypothetical protein